MVDHLVRTERLTSNLIRGEITLPNIVAQCRTENFGTRILLIADQFEEVFTLVPDEALRTSFIDALIAAFPDPNPGGMPDACLVLTFRADFMSDAVNYRPLADKLKDSVEFLGSMTRSELREAIVKPAEAVGVGFEPGLIDTILDDVERRPGGLPLLQFAQREMWGRLEKPLMTRAAYDIIDGVGGALAKRAQAIFNIATQGGKDEPQVVLFRRLFTRLVSLGEGAEDTRRTVSRQELGSAEWSLAQRLAGEDNRLVVTNAAIPGQETAELVHEALIRNWPELIQWLNSNRAFISWRNNLRPRIHEWRINPADDGAFLRGGPLNVAEKWLAERSAEFNDEERHFIAASVHFRDTEAISRIAEQRKTLNRLKEAMKRQSNRLMSETMKLALTTLGTLKECNLVTAFAVFIIVGCANGVNSIKYNLWSFSFSVDNKIIVHAVTSLFCILLPIILLYYDFASKWPVVREGALGVLGSTLSYIAPRIRRNYFIYYMLLGFIAFIINITFYTMTSSALIRSDTYSNLFITFITRYGIELIIYTISIAGLIDLRIRDIITIYPNTRMFDTIIVGSLVGISQITRYIFATRWTGSETDNESISLLLVNIACAIVIGAYVPTAASREFVQAKDILDRCSEDVRKLG